MEYLKFTHITFAALSFCGFFIRGIGTFFGSDWLNKKWLKILPHVIDTVLLSTALFMLYLYQWSVLDYAWLQVKVVALLIYIALGMVALKYGRSINVRFTAWLMGLLVFAFIVSVALTKSGYGFFDGLL